MARVTIRSTREHIAAYHKQDIITIRACTKEDCGDRYVLGQVADKGYQVNHKVGPDEYYIYICEDVDSVAQCVNEILFDIPINTTPVG
jgi:hypothetical protein